MAKITAGSKFDSHVTRFRKQPTPEMIASAISSIDAAAETAIVSDVVDYQTQLLSWNSIDAGVVLKQSLLTVNMPEIDQKGTEETNLCVLSSDLAPTRSRPLAAPL